MVREVKKAVKIPLAVKLSPFYTALPQFARKLESAGADALVLFNRFFESDIDIEELTVFSQMHLYDSRELLLRLRWLAILSGRLEKASFAVTGGVHTATDAIKGSHVRSLRHPAGFFPPHARSELCPRPAGWNGFVDGGEGVRVHRADVRQHEHRSIAEPPRVHPRELHAHPADMAELKLERCRPYLIRWRCS
jgi:hypothetical protein